MDVSEARRLKEFERESAELKKMVAERAFRSPASNESGVARAECKTGVGRGLYLDDVWNYEFVADPTIDDFAS